MLLQSLYFPGNSTKVDRAFSCDAAGSEDRDLVSADHIQVIIQSQQHQE